MSCFLFAGSANFAGCSFINYLEDLCQKLLLARVSSHSLQRYHKLRTGSIGNRDAETLINTLVEPKKSLLSKLRLYLLSLGYQEEAGYDAINIESYVAYSILGQTRFILKHKWE